MNNKTKISRRSFLGGLAALSALPVVAACTAPAPAGAPAAAPAQEVTTIEFITPGVGLNHVRELRVKFMDENPSIKVTVSFEA